MLIMMRNLTPLTAEQKRTRGKPHTVRCMTDLSQLKTIFGIGRHCWVSADRVSPASLTRFLACGHQLEGGALADVSYAQYNRSDI